MPTIQLIHTGFDELARLQRHFEKSIELLHLARDSRFQLRGRSVLRLHQRSTHQLNILKSVPLQSSASFHWQYASELSHCCRSGYTGFSTSSNPTLPMKDAALS